LASAIEACSLSPAAAATATVLAENAEDVIACLAEWRDVVKEIGIVYLNTYISM
jgi:hypothetical protein